MKQYKQLTSELRYQIYGLKQAGLNQTQIAKKIGVDKGTISREFKRNEGKRGWRPKQAQSFREMSAGKPVSMASNSHQIAGRKSRG